jgi:hypothetical protein
VGVRDRHAAAERGVGPEHLVGPGVDARDEERRDRGDGVDGLPAPRASLEAGDVRVDHLLVARDGEQQRDVDVHAARGELLDRGDPGLGRGDLDHHIGPCEPAPEVDRLLDRA